MESEIYVLWVDMARRIISVSWVHGYERMDLKNEKHYRDALMSFLAKGYQVH
ncbi:MAG: hypothetical protein ACOX68_04855 [Candidatus Limivicinus sp.]|jgi:hypothetical protein